MPETAHSIIVRGAIALEVNRMAVDLQAVRALKVNLRTPRGFSHDVDHLAVDGQ